MGREEEHGEGMAAAPVQTQASLLLLGSHTYTFPIHLHTLKWLQVDFVETLCILEEFKD